MSLASTATEGSAKSQVSTVKQRMSFHRRSSARASLSSAYNAGALKATLENPAFEEEEESSSQDSQENGLQENNNAPTKTQQPSNIDSGIKDSLGPNGLGTIPPK